MTRANNISSQPSFYLNSIRSWLFLLVLLFPTVSWGQGGSLPPSANEDPSHAQLLNDGLRALAAGKPKEAIELFEKVAASYEEKYRNTKTRILCARSPQESLIYLLEAAKDNMDAKVISPTWADAYFYKAYSLLELGKIHQAKSALERALALSPRNSQYLSEQGHIYQREKNWPMAIQTFQAAETAAREFSPPPAKENELCRAWKGLGYVFVEQSRLDEAEKMYRQCLELNKDDTNAAKELRYIQGLKAKKHTQ
ncbi:MAG: tetratricopeptide repeat protein, partial [Nitrososphaera sp.]